MTPEEVRKSVFRTAAGRGYRRSDVDELLARVAIQLEAGQSPVKTIEHAKLVTTFGGYDRGEVDRLLAALSGEIDNDWRSTGVEINRRRSKLFDASLAFNTGVEVSKGRLWVGFLASHGGVPFAAAALALTRRNRFDLSLMPWAVAPAAAGLVYAWSFGKVAPRLASNPPQATLDRFRRRIRRNMVGGALLGVSIGVVAAAVPTVWIDVAAVVVLAVMWIVSVVVGQRIATKLRDGPANFSG